MNLASIKLSDPLLLLLVDNTAKGAAVLAIAGIIAWFLRRRSAASRHAVWLLAFVSLLLLPPASAIMPQWRLRILPAPAITSPPRLPAESVTPLQTNMEAPKATGTPPAVAEPYTPDVSDFMTARPSYPRFITKSVAPEYPKSAPYAFWVLTGWSIGVALILAQLGIGLGITARLRLNALPLNLPARLVLPMDGAHPPFPIHQVRLLLSKDLAMPMTTGVLRPAILLPEAARSWNPDKLRVVLLHELAHVWRFDCLTQFIAHLILALHWPNPVAWLAMHKLTVERELACDDAVLAAGAMPSSYASHLLDVARTLHSGLFTAAVVVPMARRSHLERRLVGILDTSKPRNPITGRAFTVGLLVAVALTLPMAALQLGRAQEQKTVPSSMPVNDEYAPITPEQRPTSDIDGVVRDELGKPLRDVIVRAIQGWGPNFPQRSISTDDAGRFKFSQLKPDGYWFFSADDPRYGWEWDHERGLDLPTGRENLPVLITLYQPRILHGIVVDDESTKPVAGVRIVLVNQQLPGADMPISGHFDTDFLTARSDASGHFTMSRLRPGKATFWLERSGYANTLTSLNIDGNGDQTLTINRGLTLRGRVVHNGTPMPGITLHAGYAESHRLMLNWDGKTDSDGRFEIPHIPSLPAAERSDVPAAPVSVDDHAWSSDYVDVYQTADGVLPDITIELKPRTAAPAIASPTNVGKPGESTGAVRVALPGLIGQLMIFIGSQMQTTTAATVIFDSVPVGRHQVWIRSTDGRDRARRPQFIDVVAGKTTDITMESGPCQLRGIIRSAGQPVSGPGVYLSWFAYPPGSTGLYAGNALVQSDGTYSVRGLTPGAYELVFQGPESMAKTFMTHVGSAGQTVCDLNLPTGRIDGQLVGVAPRRSQFSEVGTIDVWPRGFPPRIPADVACTLDPDSHGRFTVENLEPGWYSVVGYGLEDTVEIDRDGATATATLRPPEKTGDIAGSITGRLPSSAGAPFHAIYVTAFPKNELGYDFHDWGHQAKFNPQSGTYHIRNLPVGSYGVLVTSDPELANSLAVTWIPDIEVRNSLSRDLSITISEGRSVHVITADRLSRDRSIPTCAGWRLRMPSGDWLDGRILSGALSLPIGQYTIEAQYGPSGVIVSQPITVNPGEGTEAIDLNGPNQETAPAPATQ